MKVLQYCFFPGGGIGRYAHEFARAMNSLEDVQIETVCTPEYEYISTDAYSTAAILQSISSSNPIVRKTRFLAAQWTNPRRLIRYSQSHGADIIHFQNINHLSYLFWRKKIRNSGVPFSVTAHDVRRSKSIINRRWETRGLQAFYRDAAAIFVHSYHQANELQEFAGVSVDRIHIVPFGSMPYGTTSENKYDLRRKWEIPVNREVALAFGNLRDDKNIDNLLVAMSILPSRPFLILAGRSGGIGNHSNEHYERLVKELELENDVLFLKRYFDDLEVGELFEMCDYVALPYKITFTSQSAVLGVAMHYNRPCLVTPAPTLSQTTSQFDVGAVCEDDSIEGVCAGMELMSRKLKQKNHFDFCSFRKLNNWSENASKTYDVFQTLSSQDTGRTRIPA